ncbi:hypothetical protein [Eubacterium sp.]|uniref:hypothetical protein n=1 Tax=Eubacterium sp. TaxID=142586 RepID=UPI0025CF1ECD|nr:hypothetical protein [Eubacterium sp.]MCR5630239.1 hypothetical protein [Eubacterium sp.]
MSYKKNGRNKAYENLKANPDMKKHMLEACIEADKEDSLSVDELGIRRTENMKKKEYGDIFKRVVVASFSLIATGAIIAGVIQYNGNKNNDSKVAKTTERITEETTEKTTENLKEDDYEKKVKELGLVDPLTYTKNCLKKISKNCYDKDGKLKPGYEKKEYVQGQDNRKLEIVGKDFIEVDKIDGGVEVHIDNSYHFLPDEKYSNFKCDEPGNIVYFVCGDKQYRVLVDVVLMDGMFPVDSIVGIEDGLWVEKDGNHLDSIVYKSTDWGRGYNYSIKDGEAEYSGIFVSTADNVKKAEFDMDIGRIIVTHDKEEDFDTQFSQGGDGNIYHCSRVGLYNKNDKKVDEIISRNLDGYDSKKNGNIYDTFYYVTDDNHLYEMDNVYFEEKYDFESKIYKTDKTQIRCVAVGVIDFQLEKNKIKVDVIKNKFEDLKDSSLPLKISSSIEMFDDDDWEE